MRCSFPAHAERVRDAIDVIEPRSDQRDLENGFVIKALGAQTFMILRRDARGVFGQLHDVIEHRAILRADRSGAIIFAQRLHELFIQRDPTQKLCVRLNSIKATIRD